MFHYFTFKVLETGMSFWLYGLCFVDCAVLHLQVFIYDLRTSAPMRVKDHMYVLLTHTSSYML